MSPSSRAPKIYGTPASSAGPSAFPPMPPLRQRRQRKPGQRSGKNASSTAQALSNSSRRTSPSHSLADVVELPPRTQPSTSLPNPDKPCQSSGGDLPQGQH